MPQLDPTPWFSVLLSSWMIFLLFSPTKTSKYENLNDPAPKMYESLNKSWFWPWL